MGTDRIRDFFSHSKEAVEIRNHPKYFLVRIYWHKRLLHVLVTWLSITRCKRAQVDISIYEYIHLSVHNLSQISKVFNKVSLQKLQDIWAIPQSWGYQCWYFGRTSVPYLRQANILGLPLCLTLTTIISPTRRLVQCAFHCKMYWPGRNSLNSNTRQ